MGAPRSAPHQPPTLTAPQERPSAKAAPTRRGKIRKKEKRSDNNDVLRRARHLLLKAFEEGRPNGVIAGACYPVAPIAADVNDRIVANSNIDQALPDLRKNGDALKACFQAAQVKVRKAEEADKAREVKLAPGIR